MISAKTIEKAVYDLCIEANTVLKDSVVEKILAAYEQESSLEAKQALLLILKNAKISYQTRKPLCQDTGQVLCFVKIGEKAQVENLIESINAGVARAYDENFYRKSIVKNSIFDRTNTNTNTPCIVYTDITKGESLQIDILIKGAGAENVSAATMLSPTATEDEVLDFVMQVVKKAGSKACPPMFIGVGIGGTIDYASTLSKKALLLEKDIDESHHKLSERIKKAVNDLNIGVAGLKSSFTALDVKILSDFTHIACMPVAVTINCHSSRHAKCIINNEKIEIIHQSLIENYEPEKEDFSDYIKINTSDIETLKSLKTGQKVLLSGEIYTSRDMAHKNLTEMIEKGEKLPLDLKNKILFYAGPCPCRDDEIIGSVGPTTSSRMDKFAPALYKAGILATIGKGERSAEVLDAIRDTQSIYFTAIGGIACYLSQKIVKKELVAFEELGTEAIFRLEVRDLPLRVDYC